MFILMSMDAFSDHNHQLDISLQDNDHSFSPNQINDQSNDYGNTQENHEYGKNESLPDNQTSKNNFKFYNFIVNNNNYLN
jgi:hypothetical protein